MQQYNLKNAVNVNNRQFKTNKMWKIMSKWNKNTWQLMTNLAFTLLVSIWTEGWGWDHQLSPLREEKAARLGEGEAERNYFILRQIMLFMCYSWKADLQTKYLWTILCWSTETSKAQIFTWLALLGPHQLTCHVCSIDLRSVKCV